MMMNPPPVKEQGRLAELDAIEKELANGMLSASIALQELSKEAPKMKLVDAPTSAFLTSLHKVDTELSKQIHYLTQVSSGQSHEGSVYAPAKTLSMGRHRIEHARLRLAELERVNTKYNGLVRDHPLQQQIQAQSQIPPGQGSHFGPQGAPGHPHPGPPIGHQQQPPMPQPHFPPQGQQMGHQQPPQSPYYNPGQQGYHQ